MDHLPAHQAIPDLLTEAEEVDSLDSGESIAAMAAQADEDERSVILFSKMGNPAFNESIERWRARAAGLREQIARREK